MPRILINSYNSRSLNDISEYLYTLISSYNKFYSENKILTEKNIEIKESWLYISKVTYDISIMLLDVLGLKLPEKM